LRCFFRNRVQRYAKNLNYVHFWRKKFAFTAKKA
jgi:hypothetical protein